MIHLAELTRVYRSPWRRGGVRALDGVSLDLAGGSAVGLIGLNGAGKTTLLRMLLGYLRPTSGVVEIDGLHPRRYTELHGIGYVPERVAIPRSWSVEGALQAYAMLGEAGEDAPERVERTLQRLGLEGLRRRRVGSLSKGNVQRLALAQAVLCERRVLVLDEPTDALDPVWIAELREILREWRAADPQRLLIVASHNLPQVQRIADRVVVLHGGRVKADFTPVPEPLEEAFLSLVRTEEGAR